jgi:hypothetical protein
MRLVGRILVEIAEFGDLKSVEVYGGFSLVLELGGCLDVELF